MDYLPIEIIQNHIFPHLIYHSKNDLKLFLKKYTLVSKSWRNIIISKDFINYLFKYFEINRPKNILNKSTKYRLSFLIKTVYIHDINLEQKFKKIDNRQIVITEEISINGFIEKIELIQELNNFNKKTYNNINLFTNLKPYDLKISIKLYVLFPNYINNENNFNRYKLILEINDENMSLEETVYSTFSLDNFNLKVYGNCKLQKNENNFIINI